MPEIGTSGLMSGERKRSVAAWPKLPRLSSTLLAHAGYSGAFSRENADAYPLAV
jgi:hypothetical protein